MKGAKNFFHSTHWYIRTLIHSGIAEMRTFVVINGVGAVHALD